VQNVSQKFVGSLRSFLVKIAEQVRKVACAGVGDETFNRNFAFFTETQFTAFIKLVW
jgi:hypothetical protein